MIIYVVRSKYYGYPKFIQRGFVEIIRLKKSDGLHASWTAITIYA